MREYKIFSIDDIIGRVGMPEEFWRKTSSLSEEERNKAVRAALTWPDGFLEKLTGRPLEAQMDFYRIVETEVRSRTAYGEITSENRYEFGCALKDYRGLNALIVEDGVLVGVMIASWSDRYGWGAPAFPYRDICTYYASDDNGSGSKDRIDYAHLCCVMPED